MFRLPLELKTKIYEYDATCTTDWYTKTVHQIKFGPTLQIVKTIKYLDSYFFSVQYRRKSGLCVDVESTQSFWWDRFRNSLFIKKRRNE